MHWTVYFAIMIAILSIVIAVIGIKTQSCNGDETKTIDKIIKNWLFPN